MLNRAGNTMKTITTRHLAWGLCAVAVAAATPAFAGSFDFGGDTTLDYKATANYGLAIRTRDPDQRLINAPVEELPPYLYGVQQSPAPRQPPQIFRFARQGLSQSLNPQHTARTTTTGTLNTKRLQA